MRREPAIAKARGPRIRAWAVGGLVVALMVFAASSLFQGAGGQVGDLDGRSRAAGSAEATSVSPTGGPRDRRVSSTEAKRRRRAAVVDPARAAELRRQLAHLSRAALESRAAGDERSEASSMAPPTPRARASTGQLVDRMGLDEATKQALHRDFMPLVDECLELARDRSVALTGTLQIDVGLVGDPDLGAVVDTVAFGDRAQGPDAYDTEMMQCLRETALSLQLPPPSQGGRADMMFTIPLEEPSPGG